ncbi:hypothetical protein Sjap_001948 [Stephania japonica]|uniref:Protein kinase domain-containing protein n=1 Tax=Stephania japonica TaxID=461633 RepID=A0AAP0KKX8_9MAGN
MQVVCLILLGLLHFVNGGSDLDALLELKKSIEEDPLKGHVLGSWNGNSVGASDGCPQNWYGIVCDEGQVTSIALNNLGLTGSFHFSALISLQKLQNISISDNQFEGIVDSDVGSIGSLRFLDLSRNSFHGSIPSELMKLKNLAYLNVSFNSLGGKIPAGLQMLKLLKYLDLRFNKFSGDISNVLMEMQNVEYVDLSSNQFSGSLDLDLENSSFVSTVQYLNVSHNSLVGELFEHDGMPFFDSLAVFDASYNQLVGPIPSFSFVVSLRVLSLRSNLLSGSLPEALLRESSMILSDLDLSLNQIDGPLGSITSATLRNLNLSSNRLSGALPERIGHCSVLDLSHNSFTGSVSRVWSWGNYVELINLSSNSLVGTLSNRTSQFLRLTSLKISNNSLSGALPPLFGSLPLLKVIDLSFNQLNDSIPWSLLSSLILVELNLSNNGFNGPLALHSASNISSEASSQNSSLLSLDLSSNSLNGPLPSELSQLIHLLYLDLSNNKFEGSIPGNFPDGLQELNVSYNNLSGVVPDNLRRFPDSAFHPGNSLLIYPQSLSSPKDDAETAQGGKPGSHMRPAIRAALIASFVVGASAIALLAIVVYCITQKPEFRHRTNVISDKATGIKGVPQGGSSLTPLSEPPKNEEHSQGFVNISQDHLLSSEMEHGNTSAFLKGPTIVGLPESSTKYEGLSSPLSLFSSSTSYPNDPRLFENPIIFNSRSPDKLAGDLHLFNSSHLFTLEELSRAPAEVIGRSCHGMSYKATLSSGHILAVKWLSEGLAKDKKEFVREVKKLGNIRHPNLVSLKGYYWGPKEHEKLTISDFIDASSLDMYLYANEETEARKFPSLTLHQRLKIAIDVAGCLNYLHNERAIPHGNLKSTNILLQSSDMSTLLTDYSLHRIMTTVGTAEQVLNSGALGYRPPEFANSSKPCPSLKSDVYAFGVILLELLTGKSAGEIVYGNLGVVDLTDWVRFMTLKNHSIDCLDRKIPGLDTLLSHPQSLNEMLHVALRCTLPASERPDIRTIFEDLSSIIL